jgi:transposase
VRVTAALSRLLRVPGIFVKNIQFTEHSVVVTVVLRRRRLCCPKCDFETNARYDRRPVSSSWRHVDLDAWRLEVRANLRRLSCPTHGVLTESVPFARAGSHHTGDFEDLGRQFAHRPDRSVGAAGLEPTTCSL